MDIDEFLDRELGDLNIGAARTENPSSGAAGQPDNVLSGQFFSDAKSSLTNANLEQAENSYHQLWQLLLQQKLKWNRELYEQLLSLSKQFSGTLSRAHEEMKSKAGRIYELVSRAGNFLKEGKKDMALKAYSQIQEISNSIPNIFFEEKRALQERINLLYRDIVSATDAELIRKISAIVREISMEIERINSCIMANDIENASALYSKSVESYNRIPEGFSKDKISIGLRLLDIYRSLSVSMEIQGLQKLLAVQPMPAQQPAKAPVKSDAAPDYAQQRPQSPYQAKTMSPIRASYQIQTVAGSQKHPTREKYAVLRGKREHAKKNIKKGFYNEAWKDIEGALEMDPGDVESKALRAKIKTLQ